MTDLAAKYENAPHALVIVVKTRSQELHIPVGTFPTRDDALNASSKAHLESEAIFDASPLAGSGSISTMVTPAPENWQERLSDVLTSLKEEQDEHDTWVASLRSIPSYS